MSEVRNVRNDNELTLYFSFVFHRIFCKLEVVTFFDCFNLDDGLLVHLSFCHFQVASFWLDSSNYTELTRGMYASKCQYPLNFSVPQRMHGCNEHNLKVLKGASNEEISTLLENVSLDLFLTRKL